MEKVKFLLLAGTLAVLVAACGRKESGELIGVEDRPSWKGINPYGMVYIPSGSLTVGASDQDVSSTFVQRPKTISIQGFYMDETEITNNEYRQFVNWVRDSIAHTILGHYRDDDSGIERLDWDYELDWEVESENLEEMFYLPEETFTGNKQLRTDQLRYTYKTFDWKRAAHADDNSDPLDFVSDAIEVAIYPDTLVWIRDFAYSYNEPYARNYFWHPAFDDYPVVGVDWEMANAFCNWRTKLWNTYGDAEVNTEDYRLPSEFEWEYAARGGHELAPYPWGGYYVRNAKGCLLANFKPGRGNYAEDGGMYTVRADAYFPNDYGLYNMAGNVAEWTLTSYVENANSFVHDMNPDIRYNARDDDSPANKRKTIRGGSWKDIYHFLHTSTRTYEHQDTTKSYVGFRCALTFLGRSINDDF